MGTQTFGTAVYSLEIPSIYFGVTIGLVILITVKACQQTILIYMRTSSIFNIYVWMIWVLLIANLLQAIINWLFIRGDLAGTFGFFFGSCILWTLQTQLALQIIANRLSLIMVDKRRVTIMKISLLIVVGIINISVACIWIPARLTQAEHMVRINEIWDRMEKIIYLLIDLTLNSIFLRKVHRELIAGGLTKYRLLFNCNIVAVSISLSMDILIIVMMSLPNPFLYAITHPVAYSVKLVIEMMMADLISTIARTPHQLHSLSGLSQA
ncbi:hypothetical protein CORC01_00469 [Colletotrichum orchidophilum]|uniref:Integral membrane protein n=1 Tax=Colletotrichum orchidophilum TaxID=1209926 RepID=A0A1G4BRX8_9PEZI|nr:uncharacterized protein CORC01_00469 [Colletotrichum orchidophilum]OHF04130.1 hypothetical protein CORC01_00469 [Colletotrichum orchidophilum]